jgi:hypothetical protein
MVDVSVLLGDAALFAGGFFFGLAAKKAVKAIIFFVVALLLLAYGGLSISISNVSPTAVAIHAASLAAGFAARFGALFAVLPFLFILGLALGLWKG